MATTPIIPAPASAAERIATFEARLAEAQEQREQARTRADREIAEMWAASFESDLLYWRAAAERGQR